MKSIYQRVIFAGLLCGLWSCEYLAAQETPAIEEDPLSQVPAELIQILEAQDGYIPSYSNGNHTDRMDGTTETSLGTRRRRDENGNVLMRGFPSIPPKVTRYASLLIQRYDRNADSRLEPDEWKEMTGFQEAMDVDQDQALTVDELANWLVQFGQDRSIRLSREGIGWKDEPLDTDVPLPPPTISDPIRLYDYSTATGASSGTTTSMTNNQGTWENVFSDEGYLSELGVSPEFVDQPTDSQGFNFEMFSALPVSPGRGSGGGEGNPQRWGTRGGGRGGEASGGNPFGNMGGMFIVSDNNGSRGSAMPPADRVAQVRKQMDDAVAAELITADQALTIVAMSAGRNLDDLPPDLKAIREAPDFQERLANVFQRFMELRNDSSKTEILKQIFGDQNRFLGGRGMGRGMMGGMPGGPNGPGMMGGPGMGPGNTGDGNQPAWGSVAPRNPWEQANNAPMGPGMGPPMGGNMGNMNPIGNPMGGNQPSWGGPNAGGGWGQGGNIPSGNMGNMNTTGNTMSGNQPSWGGPNAGGGWGQGGNMPGGNMGNMNPIGNPMSGNQPSWGGPNAGGGWGQGGNIPSGNMGNMNTTGNPMSGNQPSWGGPNAGGGWGQGGSMPGGNMGNMNPMGNPMGGNQPNWGGPNTGSWGQGGNIPGGNMGNMNPMGNTIGNNQPNWSGPNAGGGWGQGGNIPSGNMGNMNTTGNTMGGNQPNWGPGGNNGSMGGAGPSTGNPTGDESRSRRQRFSRNTMGGVTTTDTRSDGSNMAVPPQMGMPMGSGNPNGGNMGGGSYGNPGNRFQEIPRGNPNATNENPRMTPSDMGNPTGNTGNPNESSGRRGRRSRSES